MPADIILVYIGLYMICKYVSVKGFDVQMGDWFLAFSFMFYHIYENH